MEQVFSGGKGGGHLCNRKFYENAENFAFVLLGGAVNEINESLVGRYLDFRNSKDNSV